MPRRTDIHSILVIGSGPIVIGQACEFDYSGTQACRILKSEGYRVILVNSNPATIMTDPGMADATYVEPLTLDVITSIIDKERPDALIANLGGQTALNTAIELGEAGVLEKYGVELIGVSLDAIRKGEDRDEFKAVVERCGAEVARSFIAHSMQECHEAAAELGYPLVVRPSFTMGGLGSGFAYTPEDLERIAGEGLTDSITNEVLLEESILGWKEIEYEVMRDSAGTCIAVCSIDNVDPVGVHTGDSITIAPALTLTDEEATKLRELSFQIIREVGVETGGCNIQYALDPRTGRVIVIEMNPRVSRSSALASKATGFPIAKITAKLAIGYTLDEIRNDITGAPASADPSVDYVVVKVPRFTFEKFPAADPTLTTSMKAVGEAMAIGRNYTEALQKALRSIDKAGIQFHWNGPVPSSQETRDLVEAAATPTEARLVQVQQAIRGGASLEDLYESTKIDPWFLDQMYLLDEVAQRIINAPALGREVLEEAKRHGFSDRQIADMRGLSEHTVREVRGAFEIHPVFKMVDTCSAQFAADTPYAYSTYDQENEVRPREREAVMILGAGPNRIGQGIEFDYSCVHATMALSQHFETIMVNCNPETVSTDYDISDRLYFEPLTLEDVLEVYRAECAAGPVRGVIVQLGGQTPLSLAEELKKAGVPILGTSPESIELAEDREEFGKVLEAAGCPAPAHDVAHSVAQVHAVARELGYPILVRPSFVLGGRGMAIINDESALNEYLDRDDIDQMFARGPLLIDRFLDAAIEIDVDALYDGNELFMGAIMEHIEEAGIHSGDSACVLPPMTLSGRELERITASTEAIAHGVGVRGLINIQFALLSDTLYVIEANPRASRTVPFASKATGVQLAKAAALIQVGETIESLREQGILPSFDARTIPDDAPISVKEAVLPFRRFRTVDGKVVDTILGPEMRSTGEVMGIDRDFPTAFAKSQSAAVSELPMEGNVFISISDSDKRAIVFPVARMRELGFHIMATAGTASVLHRNGIEAQIVRKSSDGRGPNGEPTVVDLINDGLIDIIVNTPQKSSNRHDGYQIRTAATSNDRTIITTLQAFNAAVQAIEVRLRGAYRVRSLQEWSELRSQGDVA
ncbi:carbamoyl-phosphate synthase large subunit [Schaalia vaccimaxillae]|uniref:carbamoyl-phosphate synthase large subunit n=1 Tax=Schaalia vaccimaxillae TaxID=183916 RepID=UPI0003B6509A|nr:carbamoyl-phosphate synthase large subunit [Schaalia vaccimaxillae]